MQQHETDAPSECELELATLRQTVLTGLPAPWIGQFSARIGSTQEVARTAAASGAASRSVFVADEQSAGRGRQGRTWLARPGTALMFSALFRERGTRPTPLRYTRLLSVALAEAVEQEAPSLKAEIKWPNDLMLNGRKVAGILAESSLEGDTLLAVVGCGVNVSEQRAWLSTVAPAATSITAECGHPVSRSRLLVALLSGVDRWSVLGEERLHAAWEARLWGRGQVLNLRGLESADATERAVRVLGVAADGSLRVRLEDGTEMRTASAEIIL